MFRTLRATLKDNPEDWLLVFVPALVWSGFAFALLCLALGDAEAIIGVIGAGILAVIVTPVVAVLLRSEMSDYRSVEPPAPKPTPDRLDYGYTALLEAWQDGWNRNPAPAPPPELATPKPRDRTPVDPTPHVTAANYRRRNGTDYWIIPEPGGRITVVKRASQAEAAEFHGHEPQ